MNETTTLRKTALAAEHARLGAMMTPFAGFDMPLRYTSDLAEHKAVRQAAGLFDLSHMGEILVEGSGAAAFLDHALVGAMSKMRVGRAKYGMICTEDGGIIDDLITYRLGDDRFMVVPNASNASAVLEALRARVSGEVSLRDLNATASLIAVQGPRAESILLKLSASEQHEAIQTLKYYTAIVATIADVEVVLGRTGYTGEDGFELFLLPETDEPESIETTNERAVRLWRALLEAGSDEGLVPAGLACRDTLRLEAGMPLYGHELSLDLDPFAAGLGPVVALDKPGGFVGQQALVDRRGASDDPHAPRLVGLIGEGRRAARQGSSLLVGEQTVGEVTSGVLSPTLGHPIALAYVDRAHSEPGTAIEADVRGTRLPMTVVALPFYKRQR